MDTSHFRIAAVSICVAALAVALLAPQATGQSRRRVTLSSPGVLSKPGRGTSVDTFQRYTHGLGSLHSGPSAPGASALRSSIGRTGLNSIGRRNVLSVPHSAGIVRADRNLLRRPNSTMRIPRSGLGLTGSGASRRVVGPVVAPPVAPVAPPARALTTPGAMPLVTGDGSSASIGDVLARQDETALGAARAYLQALEEAATSKLRDSSEPITTLVPTPKSDYREHMLKGDRAFRANNYRGAYSEFLIASDLGGRDPESLICLTHAQFALSAYAYPKAAYFLERAIKYMPELPLANLRPRGFYGSAAKYAEHMVALEEHLERAPADGDALLLLAYFRWFDENQDVKTVHKALSRALASALKRKETHLLEAVQTFWDGMVATGKVSGKLVAAQEPGSSGEPEGGLPAAGTPGSAKLPADRG